MDPASRTLPTRPQPRGSQVTPARRAHYHPGVRNRRRGFLLRDQFAAENHRRFSQPSSSLERSSEIAPWRKHSRNSPVAGWFARQTQPAQWSVDSPWSDDRSSERIVNRPTSRLFHELSEQLFQQTFRSAFRSAVPTACPTACPTASPADRPSGGPSGGGGLRRAGMCRVGACAAGWGCRVAGGRQLRRADRGEAGHRVSGQ
jgi:hypothetical protein